MSISLRPSLHQRATLNRWLGMTLLRPCSPYPGSSDRTLQNLSQIYLVFVTAESSRNAAGGTNQSDQLSIAMKTALEALG